MIPSSKLVDKLVSYSILDEYQKQLTESMSTDIDKSRMILNIVADMQSDKKCETFLHVLEHNGNRHVATFLRDGQQGAIIQLIDFWSSTERELLWTIILMLKQSSIAILEHSFQAILSTNFVHIKLPKALRHTSLTFTPDHSLLQRVYACFLNML
jgi:hypothetical protein